MSSAWASAVQRILLWTWTALGVALVVTGVTDVDVTLALDTAPDWVPIIVGLMVIAGSVMAGVSRSYCRTLRRRAILQPGLIIVSGGWATDAVAVIIGHPQAWFHALVAASYAVIAVSWAWLVSREERRMADAARRLFGGGA